MQDANAAKYVALAIVCALSMAACNKPDANSPNHVSKKELAAYLDWWVDVKKQMSAAMSEARKTLNDEQAYMAMFERNREQQTALMAREPLKGTDKGMAIKGVIEAFYISGTYFRDEKELEKVRARYGKELVDSILKHEALIRKKLDP